MWKLFFGIGGRQTGHGSRAASRILILLIAFLLLGGTRLLAAETEEIGHHLWPELLWIPIILLAAKLSSLVERWGQPSVLGELVIGVILGNLVLVDIDVFVPFTQDLILRFLAELGVIVLLFQIGLESSIPQMRQVGKRAFMVAMIGVIVPFSLGAYLIGPLLLPGLTMSAYLFIGAALTATSVGITARVFRDLGKLHMREAQMVLGAAVIDDVLGLIILAVISAIATTGMIGIGTVSWILIKAIAFLVGAVALGHFFAPSIGRLFSHINTGAGMKLTIALSFAMILAYFSGLIGLAPIVGAFAAGLVLDPVHFRGFQEPAVVNEIMRSVQDADPETRARVRNVIDHHSHRHVEELIEPIGHFLVPIFFVLTGMTVSLTTLANLPIVLVALGLTAAAFFGKLVSGLAAGDVRKSLVGWGMVPRGEVGLIFATIGRSLGVITDSVFSVIVIMVILTTLFTPPVLSYLLKKTPVDPASREPRRPMAHV